MQALQAPQYRGEHVCQAHKGNGDVCTNKAYYTLGDKLLCGVHSTKHKGERVELKKNPNKDALKQDKLRQHKLTCDKYAEINRVNGRRGNIILSKMRMMKDVGLVEGYVNIFPNYKHANRKDGLGMSSLSPKSIGPIDHHQPGLPVALNLENFHQGNKVFPSEIDEKGEPLPCFFETQIKMYNDPVPHRHKQTAASVGKSNINIPAYSLWKDDNKLHKLTYFESRQFYCTYYEKATLVNLDYLKLVDMLGSGYNLRICGYDAYDAYDATGKTIEGMYLDTSRPFGHELVLYALLKNEDRPWIKYKTFNF